jgi:predicted helicase
LVFVRNTREESVANFFVVSHVADKAVISSRDNATVFPLWRVASTSSQRTLTDEKWVPNVPEAVLRGFRAAVVEAQSDSRSLPEEFLSYCYAVCFSETYRTRYAEFLKIDFPRLPVTAGLEVFRELAQLGRELVALHLVESPAQQALSARYDNASKTWCYDAVKEQCLPITLSFNGDEMTYLNPTPSMGSFTVGVSRSR